MPRSRKSRYSADYKLMLSLLVQEREKAAITQETLCARMGTSQSMLSKLERGVVRIDLMDLLAYLGGIGVAPDKFMSMYMKKRTEK